MQTSKNTRKSISAKVFSAAMSFVAVLLLFSASPVLAQGSLEGYWHGDLEAGATTLTIYFNIGENTTMSVPQQSAKDIPATLESSSPISLKISVPSAGIEYTGLLVRDRIVGTFTQMGQSFPLTLERGEPEKAIRPQNPLTHEGYTEKEVSFRSGDALLSGTIAIPDGGSQLAVLFVSGSGQQNRDEEIFEHRPFAVIADALAKQGIASLRYDDRGFGKSTGDLSEATTMTFAHDAEEGVAWLRNEGKFSKVGIIGHSEGGTIAFILGSEDRVDFIVSLAGMAERGDSTLVNQLLHQLKLRGAENKAARDYARAYLSEVKLQGNPWMNYFLDFDPLPYVKGTDCPALILNGEKDSQVLPSRNIPIIEENLKGATVKVYPGLNHLFQHCTTGLGDEYMAIEETISPEVLSDIAGWILSL